MSPHSVKIIRIFGKEIFRLECDDFRTKIFVFGRKLYSKRHPAINRFQTFCENQFRTLYNNSKYQENKDQLNRLSTNKGKRILYITEQLEFVGGIETRLAKQINFLRSSGLETALLTQKNAFPASLDFINFHLDFYASNFSDHLLSIVRQGRFDFVEFQCHGIDYISNIDLPLLKRYCKIGLAIHNEMEKISQTVINQMDYCLLAAYRNSCSMLKQKPEKISL